MDGLCLKPGIHSIAPSISAVEVRGSASQVSATPPQKPGSRFSFRYPLQSFWAGGGKSNGSNNNNNNNNRYNGIAVDDAVLVENGNREEVDDARTTGSSEGKKGNNWVLKILYIKSLWREDEEGIKSGGENENDGVNGGVNNVDGGDEDEECDACRVDDDEGTEFDKESFSRLLRKVSLAEAKLYAQMSYLGNIAYCIPKIKAGNLLKKCGLSYVTSSIDKRESSVRTEKIRAPDEDHEAEANKGVQEKEAEVKEQKSKRYQISASAAYEIAASAASYLHSHTKSILLFKSSKSNAGKSLPECGNGGIENVDGINSEVASLMATTDSVTAVVAAKEEVKQAVADDLSSTHSSPCEWFICDDDQDTRYFVIQGSESLASWQANLLFEPVQFEGLDVLVHRGIYEAAKGIYEQILPEVRSHLKSCGRHATFRFTGHSLGGSLSLLINLMLLIRKEVPISALLPVVTFGAPSVMCGGDYLLRKLGLPRSHVQAITMHRDIVPRAFSCNYPTHVAELLKAVNGNFRNLPCLNNQKLLYAPMGELLILQPDEKFSPRHDLLPSGSGLYFLSCPLSESNNAEKLLGAAQRVFLNSPHPLEILSDRSAYGSEGTIQRDHDMNSYLKSVRSVIRQELNRIRRSKREQRRKFWVSLLEPRATSSGGILFERRMLSNLTSQKNQFNLTGVVNSGRESLKRFSRLVASQHMHLLVVLLFPARLLLLNVINIH